MVGDASFSLNIALTMTHPPFETRQLRQMSAYDVSTVRDSEKCSIVTTRKLTTGFPMSYRWSAYVTLSSPKGGSKCDFFIFLNKFNFNRITSATKFLCMKNFSNIVVV